MVRLFEQAATQGASARCWSSKLLAEVFLASHQLSQAAKGKDEIVTRHGVCKESLLSQVW